MSHKRFTALVAAASTLVACATPPAPTSAPTSAELGTVSPAYPVGTDLEFGVEVLKEIPVAVLFTTEPVPVDPTDVCAGVPADVVTPAGFAATPVSDSEFGCVWHGAGLALEIGVLPYSMAKTVEEHRAMANGGSTDRLAHLAWLRIDDHYAIERVLEFDRTKGCCCHWTCTPPPPCTRWCTGSTRQPANRPNQMPAHRRARSARSRAKVAWNLLHHLDK